MNSKVLSVIAVITIVSCNNNNDLRHENHNWPNVKPPVADIEEHIRMIRGDTVPDPYYWMYDYFGKGPDSTKVVDYLKAENNYLDTMMSGTKNLQANLFAEMKSRIKEKDESVPEFKNGYYYYIKTEDGKQYYKYCRKKGSLNANEEILLDVDKLAEGHPYFDASGFDVSEDNKLLAFGIDTVSRRQYVIRIKNLETGEIYKDLTDDNYETKNVYQLLADEYRTTKDTVNYLATLEKGFQLFNDDPWFLQNIINHYIYADKVEEASKYLDAAIERAPTVAEYYYVKGNVDERLGHMDDALKSFEKALELQPTMANAYAGIGRLLFNQAVEVLKAADAIRDNKLYNIEVEKANVIFRKSMPYMEKAVEMSPKETDFKQALKMLYYRLGDNAKYEAISKELGE